MRPVPPEAQALAQALAAVMDEDQGHLVALEAVSDQLRAAADRGDGETVRRTFNAYVLGSEDRRTLAVDGGELIAKMTAALLAGGFTEQECRDANVRELARGISPDAGSAD